MLRILVDPRPRAALPGLRRIESRRPAQKAVPLMPSPVDRNTALLEIITEGARAVMLDRAVYAECNQHLTGECADLRRRLRAAEDRISVLQQQLDQERAGQ